MKAPDMKEKYNSSLVPNERKLNNYDVIREINEIENSEEYNIFL
jgi:hypothetical protein